MKSVILLGGALALLMTAPALAAPAPAPRPPALQAVVDCRKLDDSAQRLACYDAAVAAMTKAEESGDLVALDRQQRAQVRRQAFGFVLPSFAIFDRGEKPDEVNRVEETIESAYQNADAKWVFRMRDGAVWRQIDDYDLYNPPHNGSSALIKKAALGSFMMEVDGQPALRVHRDN